MKVILDVRFLSLPLPPQKSQFFVWSFPPSYLRLVALGDESGSELFKWIFWKVRTMLWSTPNLADFRQNACEQLWFSNDPRAYLDNSIVRLKDEISWSELVQLILKIFKITGHVILDRNLPILVRTWKLTCLDKTRAVKREVNSHVRDRAGFFFGLPNSLDPRRVRESRLAFTRSRLERRLDSRTKSSLASLERWSIEL